jgi:hypothetical protein
MPAAPNDYDRFARAYAADNDVNLSNAHYERPAILALAGDVAGRPCTRPISASRCPSPMPLSTT